MEVGDFLCGLAAGWSQIISGHPLDYIKTKIQTGEQHKSVDIIKNIIKEQGFKGLYRGASSLFFGFGFTIGIQFFAYQYMKKLLFNIRHQTSPQDVYDLEKLKIYEIGVAGASAGALISLIATPVEYAKIQRQLLQTADGSLLLLFRDFRMNGIRNIGKGFSMTLARQIIGSFFYFSIYEGMVRILTKQRRSRARSVEFLMAGAISGISYWTITYPIDTIKTNMQANKTFKQSLDALSTTKLRGYNIVLLRALLINSISFTVYEKCQAKRKQLQNLHYSMF